MEFQHYFNPFSWMTMEAQEGKDLDSQDEGRPLPPSTPQRGMKEAVVHHGEVATAV